MRILVTGIYGFIGSHFGRIVLNETDHVVVGFGRASDTRNFKRIADYANHPRFQLVHGDLTGDISGLTENIDAVVNFAAKTYVDHSIKDPTAFITNNLVGTFNLLEQSRMYKVKRYLQVSTDEVYGAILDGSYKEDARLNPTNPYSATKAGADMLVVSYFNTYGLDTIITRTENNYGPWQHPQKAMPTFVRKAMNNESLPVYGDGQHKRMWLHVTDHCRAILLLLDKGVKGNIYHVAGEVELANIDLAKKILGILGKPESLITFIDDWNIRPGHDRRYALDSSKIRALGWTPKYSLDEGIAETVKWYVDNKAWVS